MNNTTHKTALLGLTQDALVELARGYGLPAFNGKQIAHWLYQQRVNSIGEMTNLSKKVRQLLEEHHITGVTAPMDMQKSRDGTRKYLFATGHERYIETVTIPDRERCTVCVSSQVGCKMGCVFCMTGKQGFQGQLTAGEILNQILSTAEADRITNIVYMGMGEPLDNLDEVLTSIEILTAPWGFAMSPRRITVSTIGITPGVVRLLNECEVHLAISLHTPIPSERQKLMPIESVYPMADSLEVVRNWNFGLQRRISFEYIVFSGMNDTPAHADALLDLLAGLRCRVNLIRFHPVPDTPLPATDEQRLVDFRDKLADEGLTTTIRASRGQDILAACGLLSTNTRCGENPPEQTQ
ncbi:MAG: 23S rRNA (adenine(2503)-C(2))-methyltransferase RlmN [Kiritimatiellae bacterium]|nr:23S rRNA (adenine(2503)-C(2))-methyltransferase RlmN [Kiritimatiellia bacterium]